MVTKPKAKFIKSLQLKKYRKQSQSFLVEGAKNVQEILNSDYEVSILMATPSFLEAHTSIIDQKAKEVIVVSEKELSALGTFKANNAALAVGHIKQVATPQIAAGDYALVLDDVRDPGNLGTIIRIADWYGIQHIVASETTADVYNPKVLNASMGSFTRVSVFYTALPDFLTAQPLPVFGATMEGIPVREADFSKGGLLVMGNEANGISDTVGQAVQTQVTIPRYGGAESLNVAIATAVICEHLRA